MGDTNIVPITGSLDNGLFQEKLSNYQPAEIDDVLEQIAILSAGFPEGHKDEATIKNTIKAYAMVVEGMPLEPIQVAVKNFLHGVVENQNPKFIPNAPELAKEVRRVFFVLDYQKRKAVEQ